MIGSAIKPLRIQDAHFHVNDTLPFDSNKIKSEAGMTARNLKQDPNIIFIFIFIKRTLFIMRKTQSANSRCSPLYQATKH